jgi:hypothetical protein
MAVWLYSLMLVAAGIYVADRLLLWAERRRWIRYRQSRAAFRPSLGNAMSGLDVFYNPQRRAAIELTQEQILQREEEDEGDGAAPDPDGGPGGRPHAGPGLGPDVGTTPRQPATPSVPRER